MAVIGITWKRRRCLPQRQNTSWIKEVFNTVTCSLNTTDTLPDKPNSPSKLLPLFLTLYALCFAFSLVFINAFCIFCQFSPPSSIFFFCKSIPTDSLSCPGKMHNFFRLLFPMVFHKKKFQSKVIHMILSTFLWIKRTYTPSYPHYPHFLSPLFRFT